MLNVEFKSGCKSINY